jgi:protein tyrosine/serine phosphatase
MAEHAGHFRGLKLLLIGIVVLAMAAASAIAWNNGLRTAFKPKKWGVVEPGRLYRSGQISQRLIRSTLAKNHIGLIIDMSIEDTPDARAEREAAAQLNIPRISLPLRGNGVGNPDHYVTALSTIIEADRRHCPVLVHCQAGTERTGGVIAAYRILVEGMPEEEAFAEARRYGHDDHENPHLVPFIEQHLKEWKVALAEGHLINSASTSLDH